MRGLVGGLPGYLVVERFHELRAVRDTGDHEEVGQQPIAVPGEDRLRVKLDPENSVGLVGDRHHRAVAVAGNRGDARGQRRRVDHQRVVAAGCHRARDAREQIDAVVEHLACASVDGRRRPHHATADRGRDRLVAEADAKQWHAAPRGPHQFERAAGLCGGARPRRDHDRSRRDGQDRCGGGAVARHDDGLNAEQLEVPREVEDEAVAVVDDDDHPPPPIPQASSTRSMPSALWSDSACSADGSLAAVIPPPAAKAIDPGETTSVRIRRLKSAVPSKAT